MKIKYRGCEIEIEKETLRDIRPNRACSIFAEKADFLFYKISDKGKEIDSGVAGEPMWILAEELKHMVDCYKDRQKKGRSNRKTYFSLNSKLKLKV